MQLAEPAGTYYHHAPSSNAPSSNAPSSCPPFSHRPPLVSPLPSPSLIPSPPLVGHLDVILCEVEVDAPRQQTVALHTRLTVPPCPSSFSQYRHQAAPRCLIDTTVQCAVQWTPVSSEHKNRNSRPVAQQSRDHRQNNRVQRVWYPAHQTRTVVWARCKCGPRSTHKDMITSVSSMRVCHNGVHCRRLMR